LVELHDGLTPRNRLRLNIQLARKVQWGLTPQNFVLPDLNPLEATVRCGAYAIGVNPMLQSVLTPSAGQLPLAESELRWPAPPSYSFTWTEKPVSGRLRVMPQEAKLRARIRLEAALGSNHGDWTARLDLEPVVGSPSHIDLLLSAPVDGNL